MNQPNLRGLSVFVFIVRKLGHFEKQFHKLGLQSCLIRISKQTKTIKGLGLRPRAFISFLVFGNPDETLVLVY